MRNSLGIQAVGIVAVLLAVSTSASAASKAGCVVTSVQIGPSTANSGASVGLVCSADSTFYGASAGFGNSCTDSNNETIRLFSSTLQAAFLAGRPVDLEYNPITTSCLVATLTAVKIR